MEEDTQSGIKSLYGELNKTSSHRRRDAAVRKTQYSGAICKRRIHLDVAHDLRYWRIGVGYQADNSRTEAVYANILKSHYHSR
jgi:hypothetical protein